MRTPEKDNAGRAPGEVGEQEQQRQPKDITFDPVWAWYRLGANARLKPKQRKRRGKRGGK